MTGRQEHQKKKIPLAKLLSGIDYELPGRKVLPERDIVSLSSDSRVVDKYSCFVALPGTETDGHLFVHKAVEAGCRAVVIEKERFTNTESLPDDVCVVAVNDCREAYGWMAGTFYGEPAKKLKMIGVTGTNGKTSITYLLEKLLDLQSLCVGVIGTVNYRYRNSGGRSVTLAAPLTTPEPLQLQKLLAQMVQDGVNVVLMEVSSHALDQKRVAGIKFDIGVFTNLSHDHLDYHRDMEDYFRAKSLLFNDYLKEESKAVVCTGVERDRDQWSNRVIELCVRKEIPCISCGDTNDDVLLKGFECSLEKTTLDIEANQRCFHLESPLIGRFNGENLLTAFGVGMALGIDTKAITEGLGCIKGVPGRLERITGCPDDPDQPVVFVDYAHTPDALENVMTTLADLPHRSLFLVFGCGGDRDRDKRPLMGEIAARLGDVIIVTDDNPRSESPKAIAAEIISGLQQQGLQHRQNSWLTKRMSDQRGFLVIHQRESAIKQSISAATAGDIVLIAGKGHETYQLSNTGKRFFDDRLEACHHLCSWTVNRVVTAVYGVLAHGKERTLEKVCTDSRSVKPGDIFVALKGDNFDGHDFAPQAVEKGCGCLVVSQAIDKERAGDIPQVIVADTLKALGDLASYRRQSLKKISDPVVIGITGSCGKTTVKEMVASIMSTRWPDNENGPEGRVLKTEGNLNNLIGMPLSLLPAGVKEEVLILEMGMNRPGEIAELARISDPDIACITNVHPAHLLGLQTIEGVARAKEELFAGCRDEAKLVVNLNDPLISSFAGNYNQEKFTFSASGDGQEQGAQVFATDVSLTDSGCARFRLHIKDDKVDITLGVAGLHNVENGLAAAAMAYLAGASMSDIAYGLQAVRSVDKRMEKIVAKNGCSILNDTYNANPASMKAGLKTLCGFTTGKRIAILGDMFELGDVSAHSHYEIGCFAANQGVDSLVVAGEFSADVVRGARDCGMEKSRTVSFSRKEDLIDWLLQSGLMNSLGKKDWILIKGSRGMKLETVVEALLQ